MTNISTKNSFFLDTSALIALLNTRDQFHEKINEFLSQQSPRTKSITSNLILNEFLTFFSRYGALSEALAFHEKLLANPHTEIVWIDPKLHKLACDYLSKFSDQNISFADASSFAIMKSRKITHALCFDDDFKKAGFELLP